MPGSDATALLLRDLNKRYGAVAALDGLSLHIARGEIYGLLGPNGAGKTTALRIVCGLLAADRGDGHCLNAAFGAARDRIGYMPQRGGLYDDLSIAENLRFFARAHGLPPTRVAAALAESALETRATQRVGTLSGGWRQRVALAAALLHAPQLLLLDEPTAGLDPQARDALWQRLRRLAGDGTTILVTTHYADEAERCDRLGYLDAGRLRIDGAPDRIAAMLGLSVWRIAADCAPPANPAVLAVRDAAGWRLIATDPASPAPSAAPEPPRLADALSWLAAAQAAP